VLFVGEYSVRPHASKHDMERLMALFAERGPEAGTVGHYLKADGSGGLIILDSDEASVFEWVLAYGEYLTFTVTPVLTVTQAVGPIMGSFVPDIPRPH
jgi:hypothetical protein